MLAVERRAVLLQELKNNGYIEVAGTASRLDVSAATIRRDLTLLEQEGQVTRTRGGAIRAGGGTTLELPYDIKRHRRIEEKRRIAAAAAEQVRPGDTVILDAGSTTYELALLLLHMRNLTVVTHDLKIAVKLASNPNITLVCAGGIARANVYTLLGPQVEVFLDSLRVDKAFLGADAIHTDGTVANVNLEEVPVKQAIVAAAGEVILLADSTKFDVIGFATVCDLAEIDVLVTDKGLRGPARDMLAEWEVDARLV